MEPSQIRKKIKQHQAIDQEELIEAIKTHKDTGRDAILVIDALESKNVAALCQLIDCLVVTKHIIYKGVPFRKIVDNWPIDSEKNRIKEHLRNAQGKRLARKIIDC